MRDRTIALNYLRQMPFSLCVREINRLLAMEKIEEQFGMKALSPVLDVGCGDGFWWRQCDRQGADVYGVDISAREVKQAEKEIHAILADISLKVPFPAIQFHKIIGNCSLEHVRDIDQALKNIKQSSAKNAKLVLFVPAPQWAYRSVVQRWLLRWFPRISMTFSGALNGFFQHWHLYDAPIWESILAKHGWTVIHVSGIGTRRSGFLFRLFLPVSFIGFAIKKITGHYPNKLLKWCPAFLLAPFSRLLLWGMHEPLVRADAEHVCEYVIVAEDQTP